MRPYILITGGAGFIGANLAQHYLTQGATVMIYDNLVRPGVEQNLAWLRQQHGRRLLVRLADTRKPGAVAEAVRHASTIFHLAAQVAVTSSVNDPTHDFTVNLQGTLHLLEALRQHNPQAPLIFTSTNKVYGNLADLPLTQRAGRYAPIARAAEDSGVSERQRLDFQSPYGCSKGAADQYVLDYARIFGLRTVVFRMSCIYGPHQFGTEDQGWVAHFLLRALQQEPITIYGDGRQVRDLLFVDDLVSAFQAAQQQIQRVTGEAFNIGGGVANAVSLREVLTLIEELHGQPVAIHFADWRPGDQRYYVSDTTKFRRATGWQPQVAVQTGLERLYHWLQQNRTVPSLPTTNQTNGALRPSHRVAAPNHQLQSELLYDN